MKNLLVLLLCVSGWASAQTKVDPGRISWPTGPTGCVYAPGTNTCVAAGNSGITALTGDVTATGTGSVAATLATVNPSPGCYTLSGLYTCVNAKGLITQIGNPFSMGISCSAAGTYEAGNATSYPNICTLSYANGTVASASLTDGSHNVTLTTPYTSGVLAYQYCTVAQGVGGFNYTGNATATNSQTASASAGTNCTFREFGGVGTAGATGATASGTNAVLVGATGTLASAGFGQQGSWGPYSPSNQYIYVLGTSNSCSFTLGGFSFLMHTPVAVSFTNQYGAVISMWMYISINPQNGSTTLLGSC